MYFFIDVTIVIFDMVRFFITLVHGVVHDCNVVFVVVDSFVVVVVDIFVVFVI